jgi:hypothetical protein
MKRVDQIANTGDHIEVTWADEADIDYSSGVVEYRVTRVPHEAIAQELITDFIDIGVQLLEAARVHRHRVADQFTAPR